MTVIASSDPNVVYLEPRRTRVWAKTLDTGQPVVHRSAAYPATRCGLSTVFRYRDGSSDTRGTWLPLRHALLFCRPCRRCWP